MSVKENIESILSEMPQGVSLVAVSKFHPSEAIMEAYMAGQRLFGESRVQELLKKIPELPEDIKWHFIGHLQTNKLRQIIGKTAMIESVDSERLLEMIDKESEKAGVVTNVLMQIHVAEEETKFGFSPEELEEYFVNRRFENLKSTHICGVMGMATNTDDPERVADDFLRIASMFKKIKEEIAPDLRGFDTLSMGMSGDWKIAVKEGSNLVRVGSAIFGQRDYSK
ncbi:MAG: YggS family pyridoxal phosphate-dependent enzyme [Muribaculaceae bacterium]|nr:YggS family pyridoxal phosphate-dependent enzyme [Muribaculaceae bacterium]